MAQGMKAKLLHASAGAQDGQQSRSLRKWLAQCRIVVNPHKNIINFRRSCLFPPCERVNKSGMHGYPAHTTFARAALVVNQAYLAIFQINIRPDKPEKAIYGLHNDTKNFHVHIAVNRVHPETLKVVRVINGFDIRQAQKARALIEKMQGWSPLENAPYVVTEEGEVAKRITPKEPKPTEKAIEFEQATGEKSAQRIAQEKGHDIIKNAKSWEELHTGLEKIGLRFEKKDRAQSSG